MTASTSETAIGAATNGRNPPAATSSVAIRDGRLTSSTRDIQSLATNVRNPLQPRGASIDRHPMCGIIIPHRCLPMPIFKTICRFVSAARLRAMGAVTAGATLVLVSFRQGDDAHRRELRVVNRKFPNNGGWNFFVAAFSWAARQATVPVKACHPEAWRALLRMLS